MTQLNPFQMLRLEHLAPSPTNPRKHFEPDALADLASTIREHGVIEPIIVRFWPDDYDTPEGRAERPLYEIIAGERRYRASQLGDGALVPFTGVCTECPKRAGNAPLLFQDVEDPDTCTDPDCFGGKKRAWAAQRAESARSIGGTFIEGDDAKALLKSGSYRIKGYLRVDERDYDAAATTVTSKDGEEEEEERYPDPKPRRHFANELVLPLVTIIDPRDGELIEVVKEDAYREAMIAAGLHTHPIEQKCQDADREAARKAEQKYRTTLFEAIRQECRIEINGSRRPGLQRSEDLALVARQFWARIGFDAQVRLAKIRIQPGDKMDNHERVRALNTALDDYTPGELVAFLLELALVGTLDLPGYVDNIATPAPLLDTARSFGLDPDAIRAGQDGKAKRAPEGAAAIATTAPSAIVYRHPEMSELLTWSGRGRKPKWVEAWIDQGGTLADLTADGQTERCPKTLDMLEDISA